jgi:ribosomal protein S18 acetylase RimI-like enzyme
MLDDMAQGFLEREEPEDGWLVLADPDPVGLAYVAREKLTEGTWNMYLIAVHADQQRKGYGSELVTELENRLRELGARILIVETSGLEQFELTWRFYRRNGYDEEGRIRDFYQDGDDKVIYRKRLQADDPAARRY